MTSKTKALAPKLQAFIDHLAKGPHTQAAMAKDLGYSPKSISNLISTVHNVVKPAGFKVERNPETGLRTYVIGAGKVRKPRAKKVKADQAPATETAPVEAAPVEATEVQA